MDLLPSEIVAHIFHFLSGKDVAFFKRLSSRTKQIINANRHSISLPELYLLAGGLQPLSTNINMYLSLEDSNDDFYIKFDYDQEMPTRCPDNSFFRSFIGEYEFLTFDQCLRMILSKIDVRLNLEIPINQATLMAFRNAIVDTNCKFTSIDLDIRGENFKNIASSLTFIAEKLKRIPPLLICFGNNINYDWLPTIFRLGQIFTDMAFVTDQICTILELTVERFLNYPHDAVNVCIKYLLSQDPKNHCEHRINNCRLQSALGGSNCLAHVIPQLPQSFIQNHSYIMLPESITFQATADCQLTLTKKDGFVYIQKTN